MAQYIVDLAGYPKQTIKAKFRLRGEAEQYVRRHQGKRNILVRVEADSADEARAKAPSRSRLPRSFFAK